MGTIIWQFEHSSALPFFGIGMKTDSFQSCGQCWVFQIFQHVECSTFTASLFRIWNSSAGIPSPPIALFIVMLPKAHLTSHSRMSGFRWVTTLLWLPGLLGPFLALYYSVNFTGAQVFFCCFFSALFSPVSSALNNFWVRTSQ